MDYSLARQFMIDSQIRPSGATEPDLIAAFQSTPREAFVPKAQKSVAYSEIHIETSENRHIWRPRDFALLVEAVAPDENDVALIVGAGAGYETALLSQLVETAIGIDETEDLVAQTNERLADSGFERALCVEAPLAAGLDDQGPFDIIVVTGAVETVPDSWPQQLSEGGRLGVVVQEAPGIAEARIYTRAGDSIGCRTVFEVNVPKFPGFNREKSFTF